jgi:outer membrane murein-binding lipoprotein Lpp
MPLKYLLAAAAIALLALSGCTTTSQENNTYASPAGIGPVRGTGNNFY